MPTYEYQCRKCGHEFEIFQPMTAGALKKCPACGKLALKRLIGTGGAILFKGSGFYATDYRSESYHKEAKAEAESEKSGGSKPKSGKSESKSSEVKKPTSSEAKKKK